MLLVSVLPAVQAGPSQMTAIASWYQASGVLKNGHRVGKGEKIIAAAHPWLPMGTKIRVTTQDGQKSIVLEVEDLGPARWVIRKNPDRTLDLTPDAAKALGFGPGGEGLLPVTIEVLSD